MLPESIVVEHHTGAAWVDISAWVYAAKGRSIRIVRGRPSEAGTVQPGTCSFALDNSDGRFTEGNSSSPLSPSWVRWGRVRVTVNGSVRFTGYLQSIVAGWPEGIATESLVSVTAVDAVALLGSSPMPGSSWPVTLLAAICDQALWPMDDMPGATSARSMIAGVPPLTPAGAASAGVSGIAGAARVWEVRRDLGAACHLQATLPPAVSYPATALIVFQRRRMNEDLDESALIMKFAMIEVRDQRNLAYPISLNGLNTGLILPNESSALLALTVANSQATLRWPGGKYTMHWGVSSIHPNFTVGVNLEALIGPVGIMSGEISDAQYADLAGRIAAGGTAPATAWLGLAAAPQGLPVQALGYDRPMRAPEASSPAAVGDAMATAAGGMWAADRSGALVWIDHRHAPTVVPLDGSVADPAPLSWASDPSSWVTDATIDEVVVASRAGWPRVSMEASALLSPADRSARAQWIIDSAAVLGGPRIKGLSFDLTTLQTLVADSFERTTGTVEVWRNWARNPRQISGGATTETGQRHSWTRSYLTGLSIPGQGVTTACRTTCPAAQSGLARGMDMGGNFDLAIPGTSGDWLAYPVTPATGASIACWVRASVALNMTLRVRFHDGAGNWVGGGPASVASVALAANVWSHLYALSVTVPAGATHMVVGLHAGTTNFPAGATIDATMHKVSSAGSPGFFDHLWNAGDSDFTAALVSGVANNGVAALSAPGGGNASGIGAFGVGSDVKALSSSIWAGAGARSGRAIRTGSGPNYWIVPYGQAQAPNQLGVTYTLLMRLRTTSPQSILVRMDWTGLSTVIFDGTVNGELWISGTYVGRGSGTNPRVGIYHKGTVGASIWWDTMMIAEGDYRGPWAPGGIRELLGVDLRSRIQVSSLPAQVPAAVQTLTVEGYQETVAWDDWRLEINTAPDPRDIAGVY